MRKRDRILKKDRVRADKRRRKAAVFILGFHRMVFTPASIRSSLAQPQIERTTPLDPKLAWWHQPTTEAEIDAWREKMGYDRPKTWHEIGIMSRYLCGERFWFEQKILSRTWQKPTKGLVQRRRASTRMAMLVCGGLMSFAWLGHLAKKAVAP